MLEILQYKAWAVSESYFDRMYPAVQNAIALGHTLGKKMTIEDFMPRLEALLNMPDGDASPNVDADVEISFSRDQVTGIPVAKTGNKNIAIIPMIGPLTKYGELCTMGMQDYQKLINRANSSPTIDGIVLVVDSPGGTVDGTPELGLGIKGNAKPIGVFGDNQVASAALWLSVNASVIVGNKNNPTEFGSIGVLMVLPNYQNVSDAGNLPQMKIYRATQSTQKALVNSLEAITKEGEDQIQTSLDSTAADFISIVKAGRGEKLNTKLDGLFAGKMFDVYQAKQHGLIDAIGTLQTAVNKVAELARQKQNGNTAGKANANTQMKFPKVSALFGKSEKDANAADTAEKEGLATDQASMEAAEKRLSEMEADNVKLKAENEAAAQKAKQLEATVAEQKAQITALEGEKTKLSGENVTLKAELEKKPTGQATTVVPGAGEAKQATDPAAPDANKYHTSIDQEAASIRAANENLLKLK